MLAFIDFVNTYLFGPGLAVAVLVCGVILLFVLSPALLRSPRKLVSALRESPSDGMSPVRAMCLALAGTLGVGNISGVASAVTIGGAGAVFWMLASSLGACFIKYSETLLALRFRKSSETGCRGGAFYYIERLRLGKSSPLDKPSTSTSRFFASLFALLTLAAALTLGSSVQSNAIAVCAKESLGLDSRICGAVSTIAVFVVIIGGFSRISDLTALLIVPMSAIYILMAIFVLITNADLIPIVLARIFREAFSPSALGGGFLGFITSRAVSVGITRGIVSNEAGCGTAPIAHANARVSSPAVQGVWGMIEVFIDTIVICTLTALVVLIADERGVSPTADGMETAIGSFGRFIPFAGELLTLAIAVFALATMLCWYYYGSESLAYLTQSRFAKRLYVISFVLCVGFGAVMSGGIVWSLSDLVISLMTGVNMTAVMLYLPEIKRESANYFRHEPTIFVKHGLAKERGM